LAPADGEDKLKAPLQERLAVATRTDAMKPSDLARVVIGTTVQPKAVMFPTDAKLLNRARERLLRLTKKLGLSLRQSYARVGKLALQVGSLQRGRIMRAFLSLILPQPMR
jgi:transposase, IS5 family